MPWDTPFLAGAPTAGVSHEKKVAFRLLGHAPSFGRTLDPLRGTINIDGKSTYFYLAAPPHQPPFPTAKLATRRHPRTPVSPGHAD
jgi:hypothetical protein